MEPERLRILESPPMNDATLLLALTGWMDGGLVSTGTVRNLMQGRTLVPVAQVQAGGFYIDNFPGSMEVSALFRPSVKHTGGLVESFEMVENEVVADVTANLAFFLGKEPNIDWIGFGDCIFEITRRMNVKRIIFMGSFGGTVPHTREPRMYGSVSRAELLPLLTDNDIRPSDYEGPGSFASYLVHRAPQEKVEMISIAAEIPGYLQGLNPLSIEAVTRRLAHLLNAPVDLERLRAASTSWELQVSEAIEKDADLAQTVRKMEEQYDNELINRAE